LEQAFLRLRDAADADEYIPTEQVIDTVLARLAAARAENAENERLQNERLRNVEARLAAIESYVEDLKYWRDYHDRHDDQRRWP